MEEYQAPACPPIASPKMDLSYKVDEGYSEDTRSQDDPESPMRMESGDDMLPTQTVLDAVMALGEGEKSGKNCQLCPTMPRLLADLSNICRLRL